MSTTPFPQLQITVTSPQAAQWLRDIIDVVGAGFHPDTDAASYINRDTGERTFDAKTAAELNHGLELTSRLLGDEMYTADLRNQLLAARCEPATMIEGH